MTKPMVSICCITYNHEPYIRECLEGFMMQKTSFPFEVLIHDDASTDKSAEIIREYEQKYPDIIKPIYQTENQYSKGVGISITYQFSRAKGKYIAMCEGDDYWTDPFKLQKQVDFLEENLDYVICFHSAYIVDDNNNIISEFNEDLVPDTTDIKDLITKEWYISTASILYRKSSISDFPEWFNKTKNGDYTIQLILTAKGEKIKFLQDFMSCYRIHQTGVSKIFNDKVFLYDSLIYIIKQINIHSKYKYVELVNLRLSRLYLSRFHCFRRYSWGFIYSLFCFVKYKEKISKQDIKFIVKQLFNVVI